MNSPTQVDNDEHLCLRCHETIYGLSNYEIHKKENKCLPSTSADAFFSRLELQQRTKSVSTMTRKSDVEEDEEDGRSVHSAFMSEDDDDYMYCPPRNYTGGKWKPGCRPKNLRRNQRRRTESESDASSTEDIPSVLQSDYSLTVVSKEVFEENKSLSLKERHKPSQSQFSPLRRGIKKYCVEKNNSESCTKEKDENDFFEQFRCNVCDSANFSSTSNVIRHYLLDNHKNHYDEDKWNGILTKVEISLVKQLAFTCYACLFYTNHVNDFVWHVTRQYHQEKVKELDLKYVYYCYPCKNFHENLESLLNHLREQKTIHKKKIGQIIACGKKLKKQVARKTGWQHCNVCNKMFSFKTQLIKHYREEHKRKYVYPNLPVSNEMNAKFNCDKCFFKTNSHSTHLLHVINHSVPIDYQLNEFTSVEEKDDATCLPVDLQGQRQKFKYKCPICEKPYIAREMKFHVYSHTDEKPFICDQCHMGFTHPRYLTYHKKKHNSVKDKICQFCNASFSLTKSLKRHLQTHTIRSRSFICDICGSGHFSKHLLNEHRKRHIPLDKRRFKCTVENCHYVFVNKSELNDHLRTHCDEKAFLCDKCPFKTKTLTALNKHFRIHLKNKLFKCDICDYETSLTSNLIRHKRIHSGDKPYCCPYCR